MKHVSLLLLLALLSGLRPTLTRAQTPDSLGQKLSSIFANIDKSQVPTGYLYEAGVRFLEPRYYNGTLADSNLTDMNVLRYLRAQFASSRVYGSDTLPSLPAFNGRLRAAVAAANGAIPIAMQYMPYASIRPDALQNNLLTVQNAQVYDVAGRSQSPYQTNVLFAAAPEKTYSRTGTVSFLFRKSLYLTGNGAVPANLFLDFGDGQGYQNATWDQPIGTTYTAVGTKRIKVKVVYYFFTRVGNRFGSTTETRESWFNFQVLNAGAAARYGDNGRTTYYLKPPGNPYGATVTVVYGKNHGQHVVKPFIVAEQYNIAGAAPHLVDCNNANNTVELFLPKIITSPNFDFSASLESAGYDLVYIDFEQNLDDITRNAQVFQYVVQQVNAWKSTSQTQFGLSVEQNVVMGLSMGGLIARYGLAAMTKSSAAFGPPDTRLLVLHDSPQRGAYNPLGLQSLTRSTDVPLNTISLKQSTLADMVDRLGDAVNVLNQPATQQLAILNALNGRGSVQANTFIDGTYKNMVDFTLPANASGPQPIYQIIATSDGSQCGRGSGAPLGVQLTSIETRTTTAGAVIQTLISLLTPVPVLSRFSLGVRGAAYGLPAYGQQATVSRMRVYIEYRIGIGIGPFGVYIPIRYNLLNESATSPPNTLPYETLPGGTTNLARESGDCGNQKFPISLFLQSSLYNGDICFVPTYSALDVATVTPATAFSKYINNITDNPSQPRVGPYIAQANLTGSAAEYNLNHLTFTARNSEWIYRQMEHLPLANNYCSTECSLATNFVITGPAQLCPGATATYTVSNLPANAQIRWSVSPSGLVTPNSGTGSSFSVQAPAGASGQATIQATLITSAGGCELPLPGRALTVGASYVSIGIYGGCGGLPATFTALGQALGTNYRWTINRQAQPQFNDQAQITYTLPTDPAIRQLPVTVTVAGTCPGAGTLSDTYNVVIEHGAGCANERTIPPATGPAPVTASVYPNPASESVYVRLENADVSRPTTVRLFDSQGQLRLEHTTKGETTIKLKVNKLPSGIYFVHVLRGSDIITRQQLRIE